MRRWLAVLLLVPGCAFALSGPDPNRPRNQVPRCDTSKALVALDGVMASALGVVALALVDSSEPAVALLPASLGALYVGGAIRGNNNVNACRAERDGFAMYRQPPLPDPRLDEPSDHEAPPIAAVAPQAAPPAAPPAPAVVAPQPVAPPPVAATPAPTSQPAPSSRTPGRPAAPAPTDDEWSEFWKEVQ